MAPSLQLSAQCSVCHKVISRKADLHRHMRTHAANKDELMHACPYDGCGYKTLQRSNVQTHIRTHTGERSKKCPDCPFSTADPGSLTRHRKSEHDYKPKARRARDDGKAARRDATAPYPSTRFMEPKPSQLPVFTPDSLQAPSILANLTAIDSQLLSDAARPQAIYDVGF
ncbi:uncharacterized protein EDB93DRAFT_1105557 [Suillus bovinus]|uniref:uncharacterized protein n=1 Tax=Suillus bovinus TaxID=48563 RepID=UPI001B8752C1|nr:uncharacterized protein EDB93DRAFT_1105557 [Suillus bovinus]KAG2142316.1 hypothetical protein EDB93DRAFT_1105557 [Suillus bovinus]